MLVRPVVAATALLSFAAAPTGVQAQATGKDDAAVFAASIQAYAAYRHIPLDQVYVDTVGNGRRAGMGGPIEQRTRLVPVARMRQLAKASGFHLDGHPDGYRHPPAYWLDLGVRPDVPAAQVLYTAIEPVNADSIVVHMNAMWTVLETRKEFHDLMSFTFGRRDGKWTLLQSRWETGEERKW